MQLNATSQTFWPLLAQARVFENRQVRKENSTNNLSSFLSLQRVHVEDMF